MKKKQLLKFGLPSGKFWMALWGSVALSRFTLGLPIDPIFLGVLGIYSGSKWLKGKTDEKETTESE